MTCADIQALLPDHLKGAPLPGEALRHLAECPACRSEVQELASLWGALGALEQPLPGPGLRTRVLRRPWRIPVALAAAAALVLVAGGAVLGRVFSGPARSAPWTEAARTRGTLALVGSPVSGDRLKGLALLGAGDGDLTGTLLTLVDKDPDTQVRLAAVDSLYLAAGDPRLRSRLGAAVLRQDRPEVQVALVDLIVGLREREAVEALRLLGQQGRLAPDVRRRVAAGITQLEAMPL